MSWRTRCCSASSRFRSLAALETVSVVFGYAGVGITLGLLGFGVWALVGATLAQAALRTILLLVCRPHALRPQFPGRTWGDLLHFGGGFTAARLSNYIAGQGEHFILAYCLGPTALGIYGRAYQLVRCAAVLFGNVLDRVLFPAMVRVQDQPKRLADAYRRGSALIAVVILPLSAMLVALAPEVTAVVLGPEWHAVTLPLQILGVGMLFRTSCKIGDALVRAAGAVYRRTWRQTVYAILVLVGAWIGQHWGVEGVAVAVLVTLGANFFFMAHLSLQLAEMPWRTFAAAHLPGLALATAMGVPLGLLAEALRVWNLPPLVILCVSTLAILPGVVLAILLPRVFLGADGCWMVGKLLLLLLQGGQRKPVEASNPGQASLENHLVARLAGNLATEGVRYCRWKSQMDLQRFLSGAGDLDLLVDHHNAATFLRVAKELGFKEVVNCFEAPTAQETHLYGLDQASGTLLHVHVNFSLGDASLDELVLHNCSMAAGSGLLQGMPVINAPAELIAFVLRTHARMRPPSRTSSSFCGRGEAPTEIACTAAGGREPRLENHPAALDASRAGPTVYRLSGAACRPTSWLQRYRLAKALPKAPTTPVKGQKRNRGGLLKAIWWRVVHGRGSPKRLTTGGVIIAIIGPDASGKSTIVAETTRWLGTVFRVHVAHLGKPPSTWLTLLPNRAGRLLGKIAPQMRTFHQAARKDGKVSSKRSLLYCIRAVLLAYDRRALAVRLAHKAEQGWTIVCDRYPTAVVGAPDTRACNRRGRMAGRRGCAAFSPASKIVFIAKSRCRMSSFSSALPCVSLLTATGNESRQARKAMISWPRGTMISSCRRFRENKSSISTPAPP